MAAVTLLGTATFTTASGTKTVTATPAVGDLIVIVVANTGSTSSVNPTDNNSSGTYTLINSAVKATSADTMRVYVRTALITSATSTVFTHAPGTTSGGGLAVFKITGMTRTGSSAVRGSGIQSNQGAATTPAPVLSSTPRTTNAILTAVFNATNPAGTTIPSTYTDRGNLGYNTPATGLRLASKDSGVTNATITWGGTSASAFASLAIELDASTIHDTTGTLSAGEATIAGSAAHIAIHGTTGALTGPGSTVVGSAARTRAHDTTGTLSAGEATIAGSAARSGGVVTHDTTGTLTGPGTTVAGSAARTRVHDTTGTVSAGSATVTGSAARTRAHDTTGILSAGSASISGAAARTRQHPSTGALTGPGTTVTGSAARTRVHTTTGALTGPGTTVTGAAARTRVHDTSGALAGPGAVISGAVERIRIHTSTGDIVASEAIVTGNAARTGPTVTHPSSGDLVGPGAIVTGAANRIPNHQTSGDLVGPGATVAGAATRFRVHETSGALTGPGSSVSGAASLLHTVNLCMTLSQAQRLYEIYLLHGLKVGTPLVVGPTARSAGALEQTVVDAGSSTTIQTISGADVVDIDVGVMVDELAALHGLNGTSLTVTATTRDAGAISQTLTTAGNVTTVERA